MALKLLYRTRYMDSMQQFRNQVYLELYITDYTWIVITSKTQD